MAAGVEDALHRGLDLGRRRARGLDRARGRGRGRVRGARGSWLAAARARARARPRAPGQPPGSARLPVHSRHLVRCCLGCGRPAMAAFCSPRPTGQWQNCQAGPSPVTTGQRSQYATNGAIEALRGPSDPLGSADVVAAGPDALRHAPSLPAGPGGRRWPPRSWPRAALLAGPREERLLSFVHTHTHERLTVPYFADGAYLPEGLSTLNSLPQGLPDRGRAPDRPGALRHPERPPPRHRHAEPVPGDLRLPLAAARTRCCASTAAASRRAACTCRAAPSTCASPTSAPPSLRDAALELQRGGVGYYRGPDFVHVDTGRVRRW